MITLPAVFDAHLHLRQGDLLRTVAPHSRHCERVVVMPNTQPPVRSPTEIAQYRSACRLALGDQTEPLITIKLTPNTTSADIYKARDAGAVGAKLYPEGVTTHSGDGIPLETLQALRDCQPGCSGPSAYALDQFAAVLTALEHCDLVLLIHPEMPGAECLLREAAFIPVIRQIVALWPGLRVVVEHISSRTMIDSVRALATSGHRIAGTITLQHLLCTHDDILIGSDRVGVQGDKLKPHNYCLPVPKYRDDRDAIVAAATGGEPYFFLGSDSAPHPPGRKHCASGCAGVWSAPVLVPSLVELFRSVNRFDKLAAFINYHGSAFYGVESTGRPLYLEEANWVVPAEIDGLIPFRAGETITYRLDAT